MLPAMGMLTGGGFSGSSSATSSGHTGPTGVGGGFNFQPHGGSMPPYAWLAIGAAAIALVVFGMRRR